MYIFKLRLDTPRDGAIKFSFRECIFVVSDNKDFILDLVSALKEVIQTGRSSFSFFDNSNNSYLFCMILVVDRLHTEIAENDAVIYRSEATNFGFIPGLIKELKRLEALFEKKMPFKNDHWSHEFPSAELASLEEISPR